MTKLILDAFKDETGEKIAETRSEALTFLNSIAEIEFDTFKDRYFSKSKKSEHIAKFVQNQHVKGNFQQYPPRRNFGNWNSNYLNRTLPMSRPIVT